MATRYPEAIDLPKEIDAEHVVEAIRQCGNSRWDIDGLTVVGQYEFYVWMNFIASFT